MLRDNTRELVKWFLDASMIQHQLGAISDPNHDKSCPICAVMGELAIVATEVLKEDK